MIQPLRGFALVEPLEAEEQVDGVYLPDRMKDGQAKGKVLAVGSGQLTQTGEEIKVQIEEGDIVYHKRFVDNKVKVDNKELLLIPFVDILAKDA